MAPPSRSQIIGPRRAAGDRLAPARCDACPAPRSRDRRPEALGMTELTVAEVLATLRARLTPLAESETVDLAAGINRVLAADVVSTVDLPAFDNAAMDGYAIRAEDAGAPVTLSVIGHALAGHAYAGRVDRGQAVRTMTGAALPAGADAVVMSEDTEAANGDVRVLRAVHAGQNVRRRGEHVRAGEAVLLAGRRLRSHDIGLAASVGADTVSVCRRLRVAILSTGDELVDAPAPLGGKRGLRRESPAARGARRARRGRPDRPRHLDRRRCRLHRAPRAGRARAGGRPDHHGRRRAGRRRRRAQARRGRVPADGLPARPRPPRRHGGALRAVR